ncbi:type II toxin-antitoxin system ParD family antitoxin [Thermococcus atlanticus]
MESVDYPISVRLPGYVVRKIDELVKKREFRSRSDFIKFAVTVTLGQLMMEEAKELAKSLTPEEVKAEAEEAKKKLLAGDFEDEWPEIKDTLKEVEEEFQELTGGS